MSIKFSHTNQARLGRAAQHLGFASAAQRQRRVVTRICALPLRNQNRTGDCKRCNARLVNARNAQRDLLVADLHERACPTLQVRSASASSRQSRAPFDLSAVSRVCNTRRCEKRELRTKQSTSIQPKASELQRTPKGPHSFATCTTAHDAS